MDIDKEVNFLKILVTGANGCIGEGVVDALSNLNVDIITTDVDNVSINEHVKYIQANLFDIDNPYVFFNKPDVLLHLAWRNGFIHNADSHLIELPKHYEFIKKMACGGIKRFCGMGSVHEVGFFEGAVSEKTPTNPLSLYGIAKNTLRQSTELLMVEKNIEFQWIRGFYIVGNQMRGNSIFSKITESFKNKIKEFPFTNGNNQFDFIDYKDFCKQVSAVVTQNKINGIINCCSGYPQLIKDRVEQFIKDNGYDIKLKYGAFPNRPYDSKAIWGDDTKIKKIMNLYDQK